MTFEAVDGIGEIEPGHDLAATIAGLTRLQDGDVVVVTSKVVSKAAGLATTDPREAVLAEQTDRVVASRGETQIVRTHHGLVMAAAGIDASNTSPGQLLPLPVDPDADARHLRNALRRATGARVAVIVSDTAGRAWRAGQTDIAIGCAGLVPLDSFAGRVDSYGNPLVVTAPAVADEIAGAAELASGKLGRRPVVVVRGLDPALLTDDDGPGAAALVRDEDGDMFGLGSREAVVAAHTPVGGPVRGFPEAMPDALDTVVELATEGHDTRGLSIHVGDDTITVRPDRADPSVLVSAGELASRLRALAVAHGVPRKTVVTLP